MADTYLHTLQHAARAISQQQVRWAVAADLRQVNLRDIHEAVGSPAVFAMAFAVADGAMAGVAAHRSLIAELNHAA